MFSIICSNDRASFRLDVMITQTRPCNIQQYFTAVKMLIFRFFLNSFLIYAQNNDCGYTLEPPQ